MERIFLLIFCTIGVAYNAQSQGCLPEGISLVTQAQVNSFSSNYPGCTTIEGDLQIGPGAVTDLSPLAQLSAVNG